MIVESQWGRVLERMIGEVIHHLNGRIMGLRGILYALENQASPDRELIEVIEAELQRDEDFILGLQSIPRGQEQAASPLSIVEAVNQAVTAKRLNRMIHIDVTVPRDVALVTRAEPNRVVKALMLLLRAAIENRKHFSIGITVDVLPACEDATIVIRTEAESLRRGCEAVREAEELASGFGGRVSGELDSGVFTAVLAVPLVKA